MPDATKGKLKWVKKANWFVALEPEEQAAGRLMSPVQQEKAPRPTSPYTPTSKREQPARLLPSPVKQEFRWQHRVTPAPPAGWLVRSHPNNKQPGKVVFPAAWAPPTPQRRPGSSVGNSFHPLRQQEPGADAPSRSKQRGKGLKTYCHCSNQPQM